MDVNKLKFYTYHNFKFKPNQSACRSFVNGVYISYPCVILIRNNTWNDYNFYSHFECYYLDGPINILEIGTVRIIQSDKNLDRVGYTSLPTEFDELDKDTFFSRGLLSYYLELNKHPHIKEKILSALNDIHFFNYSRDKISKKNINLATAYDFSLYRDDFFMQDIPSEYAKDSKTMLNHLRKLVTMVDRMEDQFEKSTLLNLLYGSIISTLETYLGDAFRYYVFNHNYYFYSFLKNYDFEKGEKKISWKELGIKGDKIGDFIEKKVRENIDRISFHNLRYVNQVYIDILNIELPDDWYKFNDAIQKRHDIFHRNGKTLAGNTLEIGAEESCFLIDDVKKFIEDMECMLLTQINHPI